MSNASEKRSGVIGAPAPLALVAELDCAEREAIELGDWTRLGDVLDRQQELWQSLAQSARAGDSAPAQEAAAAMRYLHFIRRRNHEMITAEADALHQHLADAGCAEVASGVLAASA